MTVPCGREVAVPAVSSSAQAVGLTHGLLSSHPFLSLKEAVGLWLCFLWSAELIYSVLFSCLQPLLQHTVHVVWEQPGVPGLQSGLSEHLQQRVTQLPQLQ